MEISITDEAVIDNVFDLHKALRYIMEHTTRAITKEDARTEMECVLKEVG